MLAIARKNVIRLRIKRNLQWKEIAKQADVSEDVLNNLSRGRPVSDLVLARVATVLGTDLEQLRITSAALTAQLLLAELKRVMRRHPECVPAVLGEL